MPTDEKRMADQAVLSGCSILLVEDSWIIAQSLKSMVASAGMHVSGPVATVAAAQASIAEKVPQMALVDVNLGSEMAYGLIDQLVELGVMVVVASGYELLPSLEPKVAAILTKPIRADVLITVLSQVAAAGVTR